MQNPIVNFSFVFLYNKDPEKVLGRIKQEWRKGGGKRLYIKELRTHEAKGTTVLYLLHNKGTESTLHAEAIIIMSNERDQEAADSMNDFPWAEKALPVFAFSRKVPNIPGQDTQKMQKMPWKMKDFRKALHIVCGKDHVLHIQALMEVAKRR